MAQTQAAAGALEGMEALRTGGATCERSVSPTDARSGRIRARGTGGFQAPPSPRVPNAYWADLGLKGFTDPYRRFRDAERTAGCGPARPVVWEGPG